MMSRIYAASVLYVFLVMLRAASAAETPHPAVDLPRVSRVPRIEDFLQDAPRQPEIQVTEFRQRQPNDGAPVSLPTTAYLSYDEKVNYQFTRSFSLRAIVDYNAVLPNQQLVDLEREKRINLDFLATYLLHPGTALYLGYGDRYENLRLPNFQRVGAPGYSTGRQVFVKLSYLLRL